MEKKVKKVRAVVINEKGHILVMKTNNNIYMLPGGKIDDGESNEEALKREVLEEAGISLLEEEIKGPFFQTGYHGISIDKPTKQIIRKYVDTQFYIAHTNLPIDETKMKMTEREKARGQKPCYMNISILRYQIEQERDNPNNCERKKRYDKELLQILDKFRSYQIEKTNQNSLLK